MPGTRSTSFSLPHRPAPPSANAVSQPVQGEQQTPSTATPTPTVKTDHRPTASTVSATPATQSTSESIRLLKEKLMQKATEQSSLYDSILGETDLSQMKPGAMAASAADSNSTSQAAMGQGGRDKGKWDSGFAATAVAAHEHVGGLETGEDVEFWKEITKRGFVGGGDGGGKGKGKGKGKAREAYDDDGKEVVVVDKEKEEEAARSREFGFPLPDIHGWDDAEKKMLALDDD